MKVPMGGQRGGFVMGLVVGLLVGLALALGVALYITKAPVPFINKVPQRTAEQDSAEIERNRTWDPNGPLGTKPPPRVAAPSASGVVEGLPAAPPTAAPAAALPPAVPPAVTPTMPPPAAAAQAKASQPKPATRDPAALLAGGSAASAPAAPARPGVPAADPFFYFVQAGAYTRTEDAEQQRARLALMGQTARITEREQVGRTVYRVRMGPLPTREEAAALQEQLQEQSIEAQIVRVERP